jgi:hypothetical protein
VLPIPLVSQISQCYYKYYQISYRDLMKITMLNVPLINTKMKIKQGNSYQKNEEVSR